MPIVIGLTGRDPSTHRKQANMRTHLVSAVVEDVPGDRPIVVLEQGGVVLVDLELADATRLRSELDTAIAAMAVSR